MIEVVAGRPVPEFYFEPVRRYCARDRGDASRRAAEDCLPFGATGAASCVLNDPVESPAHHRGPVSILVRDQRSITTGDAREPECVLGRRPDIAQPVLMCDNAESDAEGDAMERAVHAAGLTKRYGDFVAVKGIDFDVPFGICFGILGPNGAGKTTTIRMITCRFPPDGGTLHVLGLDVRTHGRRIKERFGLVPQENNLDEDLSLLENLELYGRYFGMAGKEARRKAVALREFMQLAEKARTREGAVGRHETARHDRKGLDQRPGASHIDERLPGSIRARAFLWDRLRDLKDRGVTLLLTTHYMDEAERLCDELVIMHEGAIIDRDTPRGSSTGTWALGSRDRTDGSARPEGRRSAAAQLVAAVSRSAASCTRRRPVRPRRSRAALSAHRPAYPASQLRRRLLVRTEGDHGTSLEQTRTFSGAGGFPSRQLVLPRFTRRAFAVWLHEFYSWRRYYRSSILPNFGELILNSRWLGPRRTLPTWAIKAFWSLSVRGYWR